MVAEGGTFRAAMTVALERDVKHARGAPAVATAEAPHVGSGMDPALRGELDRYCVDCHDASSEYGDFTKPSFARKVLVDMADKVAFGTMPKEHELATGERERLVSLFVEQLWTDPAQRTEARRYFIGRGRGLPAQQVDNVLYQLGQLVARPTDLQWAALERSLWTDQDTVTPGLVGMTALALVQSNAHGRAARACVRATAPRTLSRWPLDPWEVIRRARLLAAAVPAVRTVAAACDERRVRAPAEPRPCSCADVRAPVSKDDCCSFAGLRASDWIRRHDDPKYAFGRTALSSRPLQGSHQPRWRLHFHAATASCTEIRTARGSLVTRSHSERTAPCGSRSGRRSKRVVFGVRHG